MQSVCFLLPTHIPPASGCFSALHTLYAKLLLVRRRLREYRPNRHISTRFSARQVLQNGFRFDNLSGLLLLHSFGGSVLSCSLLQPDYWQGQSCVAPTSEYPGGGQSSLPLTFSFAPKRVQSVQALCRNRCRYEHPRYTFPHRCQNRFE